MPALASMADPDEADALTRARVVGAALDATGLAVACADEVGRLVHWTPAMADLLARAGCPPYAAMPLAEAERALRAEGRSGAWRFRRVADETGAVTLICEVSAGRAPGDAELEEFIEALPMGVMISRPDRRVRATNAMHRTMFPYLNGLGDKSFAERNALHRRHLEYLDAPPGVTREDWLAERTRALEGGFPAPTEVRTPDRRHLLVLSARMRDGGLIQVCQDITELRRAEQRLRDAMAAINDSFALYDSKGRLAAFNTAYQGELAPIADRIELGVSYGDLLGAMWDRGVVPEGTGAPAAERARWIDEELRRHRSARGAPQERAVGNRVMRIAEYPTAEGGVVRIGTDITAIVRQRQEIQRLSEAELAKRTALLQQILDNVVAGLCVFDADRRAVLWNPALLRLTADRLGGASGDLRGRTPEAILGLLGVSGDGIAAALATPGREVETTADGQRHLALRLLDTGANWLLSVGDLTQMKRTQDEQLALQERLHRAQRLEVIGTMSGTMAHDFNNILAIILGFSSLARRQIDTAEEDPTALGGLVGGLRRNLDNIVAGATRGRDIVESLSAYRRRERGTFEVDDVGTMAREAARLIAISLPATARLDVKAAITPLLARMDRGKVEQILVNLCLNGSHALADAPGTIEIRVEGVYVDGGRAGALRRAGLGAKDKRQTLSTDPDGTIHLWRGVLGSGTHVKLTVSDSGCGMTPEVMGRMFEPFFTTKTESGGTGLGLPSVAEIVDLHGGAIHVRSRPGAGTAFTIMLPAEADRRARDMEAVASPIVPKRPAGRTRRALVVDDEPSVAEIVTATLEGEGFDVESFTESPRALARLRADPAAFDLIVTDQTMPDLTGRMLAETAAELRDDLPVIITTGYSVEALDPASVPATVKLVLRKPFLPDELAAAARRAAAPSTVP